MLTKGSEVHPGTPWVWRLPDEQWTRATCSFCGGLDSKEVIAMLRANAECAGSDWKSGWPHKFYFWDKDGMWKYYSEHLTDLGADEFEEVTSLIAKHLSITFKYDDVGKLMFFAPSFGYKALRNMEG